MQTSAKVFLLFAKTFYYFLLSHFPGQDVRVLKQKWAAAIMRDFGYRVTVSGTAPLPKPLILVGNHISYLDIMLLMSVHPDIVFVAKKEVAGWPIIGPAAARVGTVFVDRAAKNDGGKKRSQVAEALKKNNTQVVVFPSGTTSLIEDKVWKKGIFEIAHENSIPVQTFKIHYSPLRESAYIDEDNLLTQMKLVFKLRDKSVHLQWLAEHQVVSPVHSAEELRLSILQLAYKPVLVV